MGRKKRRGPRPDLKAPLGENQVEAEARQGVIAFTWRGVEILVDVTAIEYGRGAFALRLVDNENLPIMTRVNAALDIFEAAIGQEQLAAVVAVAPRLFDDVETLTSFWGEFNKALHGAEPGESSAS
ncbi:hypothetical protein [Kibdelosporangium phytohabitans]|uniref:Uncharacterized protein n=1 Tax=Kibdelosporangium phytohabitans TaxID=860235 RepID=A0A0N9HU27_9PSEU|nr:hypothetical protein [Kibdelosporangium phytohabitans]ALG06852.1 hypothetical protein AOZ06_07825 [Kibdelosporangium phytohabitans]MBE1468099.1 hypothetical protein [Kibdelosporangium phytohabitans]